MQKATAGKWIVFAFQSDGGANPGQPVTGDAANITANIRQDCGAATATNDTNPTELEDGYYYFDITAAETSGDLINLHPVSSTANVLVIGCPAAAYTTPAGFPDFVQPANFDALDIDSNGTLDVNLIEILNNNSAVSNLLADYDGTGYNKSNSTIGTCTTNTDMRGTDGAALASNYTAARAGYLDNINGHTAQTGDSFARLGAPAGASIAADIAALENLSAAQVATEISDALNVDTWAELTAIPGAAATITEMLRLVYSVTRNKTTQTSSAFAVRNNADSGNIGTATVSDDGTTFTKDKLT